ncbi:hypothetical protein UlMin_004627 [Ulmus minor]
MDTHLGTRPQRAKTHSDCDCDRDFGHPYRRPPIHSTSSSPRRQSSEWAPMSMKAIANIPLGESLQRRLDQNKKLALHNSSNFRALSENARKKSLWYRDERPHWLGPIPYDYPPYLTGELPGDYGFDIAALAKDPTGLSEAFHFAEPIWWRVGYSKLNYSHYFGFQSFHVCCDHFYVHVCCSQLLALCTPRGGVNWNLSI